MALVFFLPRLGLAQVIPTDTVETVVDSVVQGGKSSIKGNTAIEDTVAKPVVKGRKGAIKNADSPKPEENMGPVRPEESQPGIAKKKHPNRKTFYDPKIAVRRSLILPGLGQIYNDSWWKVPIIYGGFAVFGVFIVQNHSEYKAWDRIVKCKDDSLACDVYPGYDMATVISFREYHRRYRDLNVIFAALWYTLNGVEAYVNAHMKGFNVSDDLSLHVNPNIGFDPFRRKSMFVGASLSLRLR